MNNTFYNEILTDHNVHPLHKHKIDNKTITLEGVNPSCGDNIVLSLQLEDNIIVDGGFTGDGCAISTASSDIMLDLIIGKSVKDALSLSDIFIRMITDKITSEEKERLEEAQIFKDISHMPARTKCAVLSWHTMEEMLKND